MELGEIFNSIFRGHRKIIIDGNIKTSGDAARATSKLYTELKKKEFPWTAQETAIHEWKHARKGVGNKAEMFVIKDKKGNVINAGYTTKADAQTMLNIATAPDDQKIPSTGMSDADKREAERIRRVIKQSKNRG